MNQIIVEEQKCEQYLKEAACENSSHKGSSNKCLQAYLLFLCVAAAVIVFVIIQLNVSQIKNEFWSSGKSSAISLPDSYSIYKDMHSEDSFLLKRKPIKLKKQMNSVSPAFKRRNMENKHSPLWLRDSDSTNDTQPPRELLLQ